MKNNKEQVEISDSKKKMLKTICAYGITNSRVLQAMEETPRHQFIPDGPKNVNLAYGDHPCNIGFKQTISQPYIVAYMSELLQIEKGQKVLEIGTGSGYQAAVLASLGAEVYSMEIIPALAARAATFLEGAGYETIHLKVGDGQVGWPEHSPYKAILATCAPQEIPSTLIKQLDEGGRLVLPLGEIEQQLVVIYKRKGEIVRENDIPVRFVPMLGKCPTTVKLSD